MAFPHDARRQMGREEGEVGRGRGSWSWERRRAWPPALTSQAPLVGTREGGPCGPWGRDSGAGSGGGEGPSLRFPPVNHVGKEDGVS